jgi:hypothetical protein
MLKKIFLYYKDIMECIKKTSKKYLERPSPSIPANECKNARKKGNDGTMYISTANIKGIYTWKKCVKNSIEKKIHQKQIYCKVFIRRINLILKKLILY